MAEVSSEFSGHQVPRLQAGYAFPTRPSGFLEPWLCPEARAAWVGDFRQGVGSDKGQWARCPGWEEAWSGGPGGVDCFSHQSRLPLSVGGPALPAELRDTWVCWYLSCLLPPHPAFPFRRVISRPCCLSSEGI